MAGHCKYIVSAALMCLICVPKAPCQSRVDALGDPLPDGAIARLGTTRMRHFSMPQHYCSGIGCMVWSPNGKMIATTSYELVSLSNRRTISFAEIGLEAKLWEAATGKPLAPLENNTRYGPRVIRFSPDNKMLVAAARNKIVLWDVATGKEIGQLLGHQEEIDAFAFQDGGKTLVSVARDGAVTWWNLADRKSIRQWRLVANGGSTGNGSPVPLKGVRSCCFSGDAKFLAVSTWWTGEPDDLGFAKLAIVYDLNAQKELWRRDYQDNSSGRFCFAFTSDDKRLAISERGCVYLRETMTGRQLGKLGDLYPSGMDFSPDGKTVAVCRNGKVYLWSPNDKPPVREFEIPLQDSGYHTFAARPAFSPDGKKLAIDRERTFQVLDITKGKPAVAWPSYDDEFKHLVFSADGRSLFASTNRSDQVSIDAVKWRERAVKEPPWDDFENLHAISMDGAFCVGENKKNGAVLFDIKSGQVVARLDMTGRNGIDCNSFFSPKSHLYVTRGVQLTKYTNLTGNYNATYSVFAVPSGKRLFKLFVEGATGKWSFSADESRVAFFAGSTGTVHVYDTATGKLLWQYSEGIRDSSVIALSADGNLLAVWTPRSQAIELFASPKPDGRTLQDVPNGKLHRSLTLNRAAEDLRDEPCLAWSPDNRLLAAGGYDNSVRLWDVSLGRLQRELRGHQAPATCLAFSPDGKVLASASKDTTLLIWKIQTGK